jgi:hypothetical protein
MLIPDISIAIDIIKVWVYNMYNTEGGVTMNAMVLVFAILAIADGLSSIILAINGSTRWAVVGTFFCVCCTTTAVLSWG